MFKPCKLPLIRKQSPSFLADKIVGVEAKGKVTQADLDRFEKKTGMKINFNAKPHEFKYLDRGHSFSHGFYVIDKNLSHVYLFQNRKLFNELWRKSINKDKK